MLLFSPNTVDFSLWNLKIITYKTIYYKISWKKFEPEPGFEPRTSVQIFFLRSYNLNFPRHKLWVCFQRVSKYIKIYNFWILLVEFIKLFSLLCKIFFYLYVHEHFILSILVERSWFIYWYSEFIIVIFLYLLV